MRPAIWIALAAIAWWPEVAIAGEVQIGQISNSANANGCTLCDFVITDDQNADTPVVAATPGPPGTSDIIQLGDNDIAVGIVVGPENYLGQFQLGSNDRSVVGLIAERASVNVVQNGDNLDSRLLVWGNPGGTVTVYQPQGSAPVNAAILTAKDGTQVVLPGNATTVIRR